MNKIKIILIVFFGLIALQSCQNELDINKDPDVISPDEISMKTEFPAATTGVVGVFGSYNALIGGFWSQYFTQSAAANQYKTIDNYSIGTNDMTGAWGGMYDALLDIRNIKKKAESVGNWNYYLMATTLEVYASQILVDSYGPIPYTEANNTAILNPVFDSEQVVYDNMVADLQLALSKDLSTSNTDEIPSTDDLVFGGNMTSWTKFANTLLLKLYLRQTEIRPAVAQAGITTLLSSGAQFLTSDAAITQFIDAPDKSNPLYESDRRQLNVGTNLRASTTLYSYLADKADTRFSKFYNSGPSQNQGDYDNAANSGAAVIKLSATDAVYFISKAESYFLQAEAQLRYGSATSAKTLYESGVLAAFSKWSLDGSSFVSGAYAYPNGAFADNLKAIITQKWIENFPGKGMESFFEHNRTGIPAVSAVAQSSPSYVPGTFRYSITGTTGGAFPKRIVYPQTEAQRNSNFPGLVAITQPVWYDN